MTAYASGEGRRRRQLCGGGDGPVEVIRKLGHPMRILRSIVGPEAALVSTIHAEVLQGRRAGAELGGDDDRRCEAVAFSAACASA